MSHIFEKNKLYDILGSHLVKTLKEHEVFIAGGTVTSLFSGNPINDIDLYFRSEASLVELVERIYEDSSDWVHALTKKALLVKVDDKEVQLIHFKYFENAEQIFDSFDFTICMGAFDFKTEEFILHNDFLKHNAQRQIRFNKDTAFPIVSLLRVQKYKDKGYYISKPEFLRIALRCMDLEIDSIEKLKEHLGGMYGINYDKLISLDEGEEFSISKVIDKIADLSLSEDYFKKPEKISFNNVDDIIDLIEKETPKITRINGYTYKLSAKGALKKFSKELEEVEEFDGKQYIESRKFYKFVDKRDDRYFSHWDKKFEYKIAQMATPENKYLYFNERSEIDESNYAYQGVLIEVIIPYEDFSHKDDHKIFAKKCFVVREVPKEEYEAWIDNKDPFE
ncbi:hypothetical protein [Paenibacillus polymyxa]|uniref:hypothetical protein n=1 Tax=Paenibacillus polymyxa TaxID=1406 RepID=UPI000400A86C|nr:hypothetical protein [Paenibacillus polymyxa]